MNNALMAENALRKIGLPSQWSQIEDYLVTKDNVKNINMESVKSAFSVAASDPYSNVARPSHGVYALKEWDDWRIAPDIVKKGAEIVCFHMLHDYKSTMPIAEVERRLRSSGYGEYTSGARNMLNGAARRPNSIFVGSTKEGYKLRHHAQKCVPMFQKGHIPPAALIKVQEIFPNCEISGDKRWQKASVCVIEGVLGIPPTELQAIEPCLDNTPCFIQHAENSTHYRLIMSLLQHSEISILDAVSTWLGTLQSVALREAGERTPTIFRPSPTCEGLLTACNKFLHVQCADGFAATFDFIIHQPMTVVDEEDLEMAKAILESEFSVPITILVHSLDEKAAFIEQQKEKRLLKLKEDFIAAVLIELEQKPAMTVQTMWQRIVDSGLVSVDDTNSKDVYYAALKELPPTVILKGMDVSVGTLFLRKKNTDITDEIFGKEHHTEPELIVAKIQTAGVPIDLVRVNAGVFEVRIIDANGNPQSRNVHDLHDRLRGLDADGKIEWLLPEYKEPLGLASGD